MKIRRERNLRTMGIVKVLISELLDERNKHERVAREKHVSYMRSVVLNCVIVDLSVFCFWNVDIVL